MKKFAAKKHQIVKPVSIVANALYENLNVTLYSAIFFPDFIFNVDETAVDIKKTRASLQALCAREVQQAALRTSMSMLLCVVTFLCREDEQKPAYIIYHQKQDSHCRSSPA
jgi:hypothetical protein